jgi:hypothetical protein
VQSHASMSKGKKTQAASFGSESERYRLYGRLVRASERKIMMVSTDGMECLMDGTKGTVEMLRTETLGTEDMGRGPPRLNVIRQSTFCMPTCFSYSVQSLS